jgi:hypothetical protein
MGSRLDAVCVQADDLDGNAFRLLKRSGLKHRRQPEASVRSSSVPAETIIEASAVRW